MRELLDKLRDHLWILLALAIVLAIVLTSCDHGNILSKRYKAGCICSYQYRYGGGEEYFEDSCHLYRVGDGIFNR